MSQDRWNFTEWWQEVGLESPEIRQIRQLAEMSFLAGRKRGQDLSRIQVRRLIDVKNGWLEENTRLQKALVGVSRELEELKKQEFGEQGETR